MMKWIEARLWLDALTLGPGPKALALVAAGAGCRHARSEDQYGGQVAAVQGLIITGAPAPALGSQRDADDHG